VGSVIKTKNSKSEAAYGETLATASKKEFSNQRQALMFVLKIMQVRLFSIRQQEI
jgi:hypothetical protein